LSASMSPCLSGRRHCGGRCGSRQSVPDQIIGVATILPIEPDKIRSRRNTVVSMCSRFVLPLDHATVLHDASSNSMSMSPLSLIKVQSTTRRRSRGRPQCGTNPHPTSAQRQQCSKAALLASRNIINLSAAVVLFVASSPVDVGTAVGVNVGTAVGVAIRHDVTSMLSSIGTPNSS